MTFSPSLASRNRIRYCTYPILWPGTSALVVCCNVRSTGNFKNSFLFLFNEKRQFLKSFCFLGGGWFLISVNCRETLQAVLHNCDG